MINVIIPMSGPNVLDPEHFIYPTQLVEVQGKPLIEHTMAPFLEIERKVNYFPIISSKDVESFSIDDVLQLLLGDDVSLIELSEATKGAACSALLAIEKINNDTPLIITSSDHIIEVCIDEILSDFENRELDAGTICFNSIHPKWSFARLDENEYVIETAEKRPISRNAIAGFYYFKHGRDFVTSAMAMIRKDASVNGSFYISPVINELILLGKKVGIHSIDAEKYHNIYDVNALTTFENYLIGARNG
jgi:dTDP-glucose pyrophosphorylase